MENEKLFTTEDDRTLEQLLADYEEQQRQQEELQRKYEAEQEELASHYAEMSEAEKEQYDNFCRTQIFLAETAVELEFIKASTMVVATFNEEGRPDGTETVSLMKSPDEYAESLAVLTGGFDEKMMKAISEQSPAFESDLMSPVEYNETINAPLSVSAIAEAVERYESENNIQNTSVADVMNIRTMAEQMREEMQISENKLIDDTLSNVFNSDDRNVLAKEELTPMVSLSAVEIADMYAEGVRKENLPEIKEEKNLSDAEISAITIVFDKFEENGVNQESIKEAEQEIEKKNIPVEIVESIDGYVLNTNQEITAENEQEFAEKVENGNEVIHNEAPEQTTIDPAQTGGKVKLEEVHDIGTVEREDGVLSYEEKEEKSEQEEQENGKKKKSDVERD